MTTTENSFGINDLRTEYLLSDIVALGYHPAAALFPMMERGEFQKLADDIKANGLLEPIIIYDDQVLDGRNRLEACKLVGITPRFEQFSGSTSPTIFVVSKNLHRRHLTVGQRSAIAVEMLPLLREEALHRQGRRADLVDKQEVTTSLPIGNEVIQDSPSRSNDQVAKLLGIGNGTVGRAVAVKEVAPEIFEQMKRGEISNWAAHGQVKDLPKPDKPHTPVVQKPPSKRDGVWAASNKRRLEEGLSMIAGACNALNGLDITRASSVMTPDEIELWISKARDSRNELTLFISKLKGQVSSGNIPQV